MFCTEQVAYSRSKGRAAMRSSRNQPVGEDLELNTLLDVTFHIVEGDFPHLVDYFALSVDEGHPEVEDDVEDEDHLDEDVAGDGGLEGGAVAGARVDPEEDTIEMSSWEIVTC